MTAEELLRQARAKGAAFQVLESGRINVQAPSPLPDTMMEQLRQHKATILDLLRQQSAINHEPPETVRARDGQFPPLDRPPQNQEDLARLVDWLSDPLAFDAWLEPQILDTDQIWKEGCRSPSKSVKELISRLRSGSEWLTWHHEAWLAKNPNAESDERFSVSLEAWVVMERTLRSVYGYEGCVFGPDETCDDRGVLSCDACVQNANV